MKLVLRKRLAILVFLFMSLLTPSLLWAITTEPTVTEKRLPEMTAQIRGKTTNLVLSHLHVDVTINGFIAETKMTMTFYNPYKRNLEGQLYFPLPEGATVSGYALDINGQMVDGVVVEKERARVVFERIVRRKIDPGLVEWVEGNTFKTRVYPMWGEKCRTISLRYISETPHKNNHSLYQLPLNYCKKVAKFSLRIEVINAPCKPEIQSGGPGGFSFVKCRDSYVAETIKKDYLLDKDILIRLADTEEQTLKVEKSSDGNTYFCLRNTATGWKKYRNTNSIQPRRITVFWDASSSMGLAPHQRELNLLKTYIAGLKQSVTVQLVLFRHIKSKQKKFHIANGNSDALIAEIENIAYDGATSLASISPPHSAGPPDIYMLFSDGNSNFGKKKPGKFSAPVYIFSGASTANHGLLRDLARQTGGAYFNHKRMTDESILEAVGHFPYSILSVTCASGAISEIFPRVPQPVRDTFTLAGKLTAAKTQITLNYGVKGKIIKKVTFTVSREQAVKGERLRTYWAQQKIAALLISSKENKKELIRTAKHFGLVTPGTSLIVLESLNQYIRYGIVPPATLPGMRRKYLKNLTEQKKELERINKGKFQQVIRKWNQRVAWGNKKVITPSKDEIKRVRKFKRRELFLDELRRFGVFIDRGIVVGHLLGPKPVHYPPPPPPPGARRRRFRRIFENRLSRFIAPIVVPQDIENKAGYIPTTAPFPLKKWNPFTPYLDKLKNVAPTKAFREYLKQKKKYGNSPAFYLVCAGFFSQKGQKSIGLQVLSNIAEMALENTTLLRILGHNLAQLGHLEFSAAVFEKVLVIKPFEPQAYRDLALVLARLKQYKRAVKLLYHIITHRMYPFDDIDMVVLMEINNIIARAKAKGITGFCVDSRLIKPLDVDIRIVLTWDAYFTDLDLCVTNPLLEKSCCRHNLSTIGGGFSGNIKKGYGPEEYILKKAAEGRYKITVDYLGDRLREHPGPITLQVDIFKNYGRKNETRKSITRRLTERSHDLDIYVGEIKFKTGIRER